MNTEPIDMQTIADMATKRRKIKEAGIALIFASIALLLMVVVGVNVGTPPKIVTTPKKEGAPKPEVFTALALHSKAALVYDLAKDEVLYEDNGDAQLPLASLTKLLTVYAAERVLASNSPVVITETALASEGDNGFVVGDTFSFKDAAALALVGSSNDAAAAIRETARARQGTGAEDVLMAGANAAGLSQTYALNGTGLDESEAVSGGYGSARDIALLVGALLRDAPGIAQNTTYKEVSVQAQSGQTYSVKNTNDSIEHLSGVLFSKTGFTDLAGGNLVVVFDAGINHPIALVVLGSTQSERFTDIEQLQRATLAFFASASL